MDDMEIMEDEESLAVGDYGDDGTEEIKEDTI